MGGALSLFTRLLWSTKEIRILILGLDNAGKTTLLYRLKIGEVVTTIPTIGFNVESVTYKNLNFNVWDLGGQTSIRPYWRCYYSNTAAVVFVVDSTDIERLGTAAEELSAMLGEEELRDAALLVFANKQDQPGAKGAGEISEALRLGELKDRNWSIMACSAVDGRGVNEGMDWLVVSLCFHFLSCFFCLARRRRWFLMDIFAWGFFGNALLTDHFFCSKLSAKTHEPTLAARRRRWSTSRGVLLDGIC